MVVTKKISCTVSRITKKYLFCREIAKSMRFLKLEEGLSVLSKHDLADSLAYNSIKV
jgi:hypothetical protein